MTATSSIRVLGLWKYFGHFAALRGLDLDLDDGRFLTIFGPNGAGKTTLIKVLSTQIGASEGSVLVGGVDLAKHAGAVRRRIGVISHNTYLYPQLTAYENLAFYGKMYGVDDLSRPVAPASRAGRTGGSHGGPGRDVLQGHAAASLHRQGALARARHHVPRRALHRDSTSMPLACSETCSRRCTPVIARSF